MVVPPLSRPSQKSRLCDVADVQRVIIRTNDNNDDTDDILSDLENGGRDAVSVIRLDGLNKAISKRTARFATSYSVIYGHNPPPSSHLFSILTARMIACRLNAFQQTWLGEAPKVGLGSSQIRQRPIMTCLHCAILHGALMIFASVRIARLASVGLLPAKTIKRRLIYNRQYKIPEKSDPILVQSAFGGLGLYRTEAIRSCWYNGTLPLGTSVCEHVAFNRMVTRGQPGLFIDPAMMNHAPEEHLGPESGRTFPCEFNAS